MRFNSRSIQLQFHRHNFMSRVCQEVSSLIWPSCEGLSELGPSSLLLLHLEIYSRGSFLSHNSKSNYSDFQLA